MDYFFMYPDKRLQNVVQIIQPIRHLEHPVIEQGKDILKPMIVSVKEHPRNVYPDYMDEPLRLISEKFKRMMSKYQPDIIFRTVVLLEMKTNRQKVYHLMAAPEIECAAAESARNLKGHVEQFVLDEEKVGANRIFCASDYGNRLIVRLDVAESILRRTPDGIWFEKATTTERMVL